MSVTYRDIARKMFGGLSWAGGHWGARLVEGTGLIVDAMLDVIIQAAQSGLTSNPEQPPDAKSKLGEERRMPRYAGETEASYTARLAGVWSAYLVAGSEASLLDQLAAFGLPGAIINTPYTGWSTLEPLDWWSQAWVSIPVGMHPYYAPMACGDGTHCGDATAVCDVGGITGSEVAAIRALVRKWKPHDWVVRLITFSADDGVSPSIGIDVHTIPPVGVP